jgi:hypothetical protein
MDRLVIESLAIRIDPRNVEGLKGLIGDKAAGLIGIPETWAPPLSPPLH